MLNETKTQRALSALSAAAWAIDWLQASSDSEHGAELGELMFRAHDLLADLELLVERAGFHPETDDVDGYDPTDDANAIAESGEDDADYY